MWKPASGVREGSRGRGGRRASAGGAGCPGRAAAHQDPSVPGGEGREAQGQHQVRQRTARRPGSDGTAPTWPGHRSESGRSWPPRCASSPPGAAARQARGRSPWAAAHGMRTLMPSWPARMAAAAASSRSARPGQAADRGARRRCRRASRRRRRSHPAASSPPRTGPGSAGPPPQTAMASRMGRSDAPCPAPSTSGPVRSRPRRSVASQAPGTEAPGQPLVRPGPAPRRPPAPRRSRRPPPWPGSAAGRPAEADAAARRPASRSPCQPRTAPTGRAVPVRRSASAHSRVAVAVSRARRGGRTVVVGPTSPNHRPGP